jgi:hypothetical protein
MRMITSSSTCAPLRWAKTATRDDVRARVDGNRFRALTLDARG